MHMMRKTLLRLFVVYLVTVTVMTLLMTAVYSIPRSAIRDNVVSSGVTLSQEGNFKQIIPGVTLFTLDNFSDKLMFNFAWAGDSDKPFKSALESPHFEIESTPISDRVDNEHLAQIEYMPKYWNGFLVVLKPLLTICDYNTMRVINYVVFAIVLTICIYLLYTRVSRFDAWSFLILFVVYMLFIVPLNFQFSNAFYLTYLSIIVTILLKKHTRTMPGYAVMFFLFGGITSFVDFFTIPMFIMCMPVVVYMMVHRPRRIYVTLISLLIFWGLGYGLIWASKWVLCTIATDVNAFQNAFAAVVMRTGDFSNVSFADVGNPLAYFVIVNNRYIVLAFTVVLVSALYMLARRKPGFLYDNGWLIVIAAMPLMYFCALNNHFMIHYWFTWRSTFVTVWAITILLHNFYRYREVTNV